MAVVAESKVKENINKMLKKLFSRVWLFMPVQFGMGKHGVPDHIAIASVTITPEMVGRKYGMAIAIEAKRKGKKPSALQYIQIAQIIHADGYANYCAGNEEIPLIQEQLEERFCLK